MDDNWFVAQVEAHGADIHAYLSRRTVAGVADHLAGDLEEVTERMLV